MSNARVAALALLIAVAAVSLAGLDKRVDRALGKDVTTAEAQVIVAERRATLTAVPPHRRASRLALLPIAGGRQLYRYIINRRIAATRLRLQASMAQAPEDFDVRERLWMRLHRLQHRRDAL